MEFSSIKKIFEPYIQKWQEESEEHKENGENLYCCLKCRQSWYAKNDEHKCVPITYVKFLDYE